MTLSLFINGYRTQIVTAEDIRCELKPFAREAFREIWINVESGPELCALFNGRVGWLMYARESGDAGFSSRDPKYHGEMDAMLEYQLSNGQRDTYPASWALPEDQVISALEYFVESQQKAPFIQWHDDST